MRRITPATPLFYIRRVQGHLGDLVAVHVVGAILQGRAWPQAREFEAVSPVVWHERRLHSAPLPRVGRRPSRRSHPTSLCSHSLPSEAWGDRSPESSNPHIAPIRSWEDNLPTTPIRGSHARIPCRHGPTVVFGSFGMMGFTALGLCHRLAPPLVDLFDIWHGRLLRFLPRAVLAPTIHIPTTDIALGCGDSSTNLPSARSRPRLIRIGRFLRWLPLVLCHDPVVLCVRHPLPSIHPFQQSLHPATRRDGLFQFIHKIHFIQLSASDFNQSIGENLISRRQLEINLSIGMQRYG